MSRRPLHTALGFSAALIDLGPEEISQLPAEHSWYSHAVAVYLGDQEVGRIYGANIVMHQGNVVLDETVAHWLAAILARIDRMAHDRNGTPR